MDINLVSGNVKKQILKVAIPVIGTSFITMLYNFIDMFWVKKLGSEAIASIGIVSILIWLFMEISSMIAIGVQVNLSTAIGEKQYKKGSLFAKTAITLSFCISIFILMFSLFFGKYYINFFNLDSGVFKYSLDYLRAQSIGIPFFFLNMVFKGIFHAKGNTGITFKISTISVVANIILDPIFIFVFKLNVFGAGLATAFSHIIAFILLSYYLKNTINFSKIEFSKSCAKKIFLVGFPNFLYMSLFTFTSMFIGKVVTKYGTDAIAILQIGTQLEALSWMTASGFSVALSSFTGQNIGAKHYKRVLKGYKVTIIYAVILGIFNTILFYFFGKEIISLFVAEENAINLGITYLKINSIAQTFMCIEIVATGLYLGLSKPLYASISNATFTLIRIPLALYLSQSSMLSLDGIWWTLVISCILKGVVINLIFLLKDMPVLRKKA